MYPGSGFGTGQVRLIEALSVDIGWLREHTRLEELAQRWDSDRRPTDQLLRGSELSAYKAWRDQRPTNAPELTALQRAFLGASDDEETSRAGAERKRLDERERLVREAEAAQQERNAASRRVMQRTLAGLVTAVLLAVVAGGFGLYALQQRGEADAQRKIAEARKSEAEAEAARARTARNEALINQSRVLAKEAVQAIEQGDAATGLLFALEAVPDEKGDDDNARTRPPWPPAAAALYSGVNALRERLIFRGHTESVLSASFTPTGRGSSPARTTARRGCGTPRPGRVLTLKGHTGSVIGVRSAPDGSRIVTGVW